MFQSGMLFGEEFLYSTQSFCYAQYNVSFRSLISTTVINLMSAAVTVRLYWTIAVRTKTIRTTLLHRS